MNKERYSHVHTWKEADERSSKGREAEERSSEEKEEEESNSEDVGRGTVTYVEGRGKEQRREGRGGKEQWRERRGGKQQ